MQLLQRVVSASILQSRVSADRVGGLGIDIRLDGAGGLLGRHCVGGRAGLADGTESQLRVR